MTTECRGAKRDGSGLRAVPGAHLRDHTGTNGKTHHDGASSPRSSNEPGSAVHPRREHRDHDARPPRRGGRYRLGGARTVVVPDRVSVREPRCAIACVLNSVTPDHLDRHGDFTTYTETKRRLVRFALDDAVLGFDDPTTREMASVATSRVRYFESEPRHRERRHACRRRCRRRRGGRHGDARAAGA